jgi:bifunctional polynucleotide phosphatase/kinase
VIISNQNGIEGGQTNLGQLQRKVDAICDSLALPIDFICCSKKDNFRKPRIGMWDLAVQMRGVALDDIDIGNIQRY